MTTKQDKMKALRERASAMMARPAPLDPDHPLPFGAASEPGLARPELQAHFGIAALEQVAGGREVRRVPVGHIAPDTRSAARQPRLLPLPEELLVGELPVPGYESMVGALRELGRSLQERQVQPIVVYEGRSERYPAVEYLILVGHRRWTAACLVGLSEIDAVVVDPPTQVERVRLQYAENEDRADFSDMERVWALQQMKQALNDAPWEAVEERFQMSRGRRQELLRLAAFTPQQQQQIAQLRLRETQLRSLHAALRNGELSSAQADQVLSQLMKLARPDAVLEGKRIEALDGPTIARVVARAKRAAAVPQLTPQWVPALRNQLDKLEKGIGRARRRVEDLNDADASQLAAQLATVQLQIAEALEALRARREELAEGGEVS
jgi:ParB/RepB/Spo0J family partition protein